MLNLGIGAGDAERVRPGAEQPLCGVGCGAKAGVHAPVSSWRRGVTEAHEGFGVGVAGEPAKGKMVWRGLQPQLEVVSEGRRNVVASASEWDSSVAFTAWTRG